MPPCYDTHPVSPMLPVESGCVAVLAVFAWAWRARLRDAAFRRELAAVAAAAWIAEDTCIRFYGFYEYHAPWTVFLDRVPLMIALTWPVVILSARDVALASTGGDPVRAISRIGALVFLDAALIEPIAVHAGLWRWSEAGPFGVPVIGVLGWGFFAWAVSLGLASRRPAVVPGLAPIATHLLLLGAWWGALRWIPPPPEPWVVLAALVLGGWLSWRERRRAFLAESADRVVPGAEGNVVPPIPPEVLAARAAAAGFFAVLLAAGVPPPWLLVVWAGAFVAPWLALAWSVLGRTRGGDAAGAPRPR